MIGMELQECWKEGTIVMRMQARRQHRQNNRSKAESQQLDESRRAHESAHDPLIL